MSSWTEQYGRIYRGGVPDDQPIDLPIEDDELAELAMTADPHDPFAPDAVPLAGPTTGAELVPVWYMPAPSLRRSRPRTVVLTGFVVALVVLNVMGLCVTYGVPDPVWR
jgi:hypothetical protein